MQKLPFDYIALKNWFLQTKRSFPWRDEPTPYVVWISEIMLQQTQASVVVDYFYRWMERFPTIEALAAASIEEVVKTWEGLGYYSRARHLHHSAQFLVDHYGGKLPSSREKLAQVKGLGPYTIGAILSFAFHQKAAAVDGNAIRVLSRYFAIQEDIQQKATLKRIWEIAENILPDRQPWVVVEAIIELGATLCKRDPHCKKCPLRTGCSAYRLGLQQELPKKKKKVEITALIRTVFVVIHDHEILLRKGKEGEIMADLYEFPYVEHNEKEFPFAFGAQKVHNLDPVKHSFTRYKATLYPSLWKALEKEELVGYEWISWHSIHRYPFSSGHKKILKELEHAHFTY